MISSTIVKNEIFNFDMMRWGANNTYIGFWLSDDLHSNNLIRMIIEVIPTNFYVGRSKASGI